VGDSFTITRKICPVCQRDVVTLIDEYSGGKIIRRFCHYCLGDNGAVVIEERTDCMIGGLADYSIKERQADLNGRNFVEVKQDKPN